MPTNQQNIRTGAQGGNNPDQTERDRKTMSEADRGQQGKTGMGRDQDDNQGRSEKTNTNTGGDRKR